MSDNAEKIIDGLIKVITVGVPVTANVYEAGQALVALAQRVQNGDIPTDEEVLAASEMLNSDIDDMISAAKNALGNE